jgi:hypothetical protein
MTDIDYAARVVKGVALLDEKRPGWERLINLGTLDIQSGTHCVTAQLSGANDWRTGMNQLGLTLTPYTEHGFRADDDEACEGEAYPTLNALWRDVIQGRLSASPQPAQG